MTRARNLSDLLDSNGDVKSGALDNVPASDVVNDTTPQLGGDLDTNGNDVNFGDNDKAQFGAGDDLQIYHDGSTSYIYEQGTGDLRIRGSQVRIEDDDGSTLALFKEDAGVELRYDGAVKLESTNTGVSVTGAIAADTLTHSTAGSLTTDYVVNGSAKQWSYVNDTGASAIIDSFNTTSWTDNGTGNGTVNIASDMSNATYNISVSTNADNGGKNRACGLFTGTNGTTSTSGLYRISRWIITANSLEDGYFYSSTLGDLA